MVAEIALAASARDWPDRLHRFLLDHGGGRIVDRIMGPDRAGGVAYDVLIIDDVSSFLTPNLITGLKHSGIEVIGVYVPEDGPDAKRRLLECGISDVIESGAPPEEFLQKVDQALAHRAPRSEPVTTAGVPLSIGVSGPNGGVGITEVAVALASAIGATTSTVLVDLDPVWPSIAQRLDLPLHPNIRTALDHVMHNVGRFDEAMHTVGDLRIIGGRADGAHVAPVSRHDTLALFEVLDRAHEVVVADLGPLDSIEGGLVREFDTLLLVGVATPVGVTRLLKTLQRVYDANPGRSMLAILNQVGRSGYQRSEALIEVASAFPDLTVVTLPYDKRLERSSWDGVLDSGGRLRRTVNSLAGVVVRSLS